MSTERVGRILGRWWWFITAVTIATLVGSLLWQTFGPVNYEAEAELLLVLELPPDSEDRQFGIENSRAQASTVVIDDLVRLARGRSFLREVVEAVAEDGVAVDLEVLASTIDVFPLARGLRLELSWEDRSVQTIIDSAAKLLVEDQTRLYPSLSELGTLRLIDKTDEAARPRLVFVILNAALATLAAFLAAVFVVLMVDWRLNRLFAEDVPDLLDTPVIGTVR
ncbi:MAG: hypothetical protein OXO54_10945 [Chloroflexota bacterium]|nr:hypothetical protein [Chloroflexota bacterium]MDE2898826.1 hypothetical protein [Chloroflexota bacterium]